MRGRSLPRALLSEMRPGEWIKNVLVFAGLVFGKKFHDHAAVADALFTFVAFCAISSAGYLVNDLRDVELDRRHPDKRKRPIASGELSPGAAAFAAVALTAIAIALAAAAVSLEVAGLVALYGVVTVAYSLILKRLVIIDVMTIASLFILRVIAGAVAVDAHASQYLLVCTGCSPSSSASPSAARRRSSSRTSAPSRAPCSSTTRSRSSTRWSRW